MAASNAGRAMINTMQFSYKLCSFTLQYFTYLMIWPTAPHTSKQNLTYMYSLYCKSMNRSPRLTSTIKSDSRLLIEARASISTSSLQQTDGRQHVTAVSLNKQYTNVQKVDSQAGPTFETRLVFKA